MAPETVAKFTYDDYATLPNDGQRYEIIDGELYGNPAPNVKHQFICYRLVMKLGAHVEAQRIGQVLFAPVDVVFSLSDVVQPDIIFLRGTADALMQQKNVQRIPDLVIEVLSESSRKMDEVYKRRLYEQAGVAEYWVIDPALDLIKVYRRQDGKFVKLAELTAENGDVLESPLFPGLAIELAALFATH